MVTATSHRENYICFCEDNFYFNGKKCFIFYVSIKITIKSRLWSIQHQGRQWPLPHVPEALFTYYHSRIMTNVLSAFRKRAGEGKQREKKLEKRQMKIHRDGQVVEHSAHPDINCSSNAALGSIWQTSPTEPSRSCPTTHTHPNPKFPDLDCTFEDIMLEIRLGNGHSPVNLIKLLAKLSIAS